MHSNMKHVARRHYYAREMQAAGEIKVGWVDTKLNVADVLTKALATPRFEALAAMMRRSTVLARGARWRPCGLRWRRRTDHAGETAAG